MKKPGNIISSGNEWASPFSPATPFAPATPNSPFAPVHPNSPISGSQFAPLRQERLLNQAELNVLGQKMKDGLKFEDAYSEVLDMPQMGGIASKSPQLTSSPGDTRGPSSLEFQDADAYKKNRALVRALLQS